MGWPQKQSRTPGHKPDSTGRSRKGDDAHFRLYDWMWRSAAWRSLSCQERVAYTEIEMRFNGGNNGRIALGARSLAEAANMSKTTAVKCFATLQDRGFVECTTPGGFSRKNPHAAEWRLTRAKCDATGGPPTKAFMRWKPADPNAERGTKIGPVLYQNRASTDREAA